MEGSYVRIVTRHGLEALFPESDDLVRFLDRRVYRRLPYLGICVWAVLQQDIADLVQHQLRNGDQDRALSLLQDHSRSHGPILPSTYDSHKTA